jgi:drug/metabolite transporter (DMT)-like permease
MLRAGVDVSKTTAVTRAVLASVVVQFCFGAYGIVFKPWAHRVDTLIFCFFRDFGAAIVLLIAATLREGFMLPPRSDLWYFGFAGLFGMTGGQVLYLVGVALCGPSIASIYQPMVPVFTALLAVIAGFEKIYPCNFITMSKFGGITLGTGGAVLMVIGSKKGSGAGGGGNVLLGNIMLMCQCMCTAIYVLLQKKYVYDAPLDDERRVRWINKPISMTAWAYCSGAVCMFIIAVPYACFKPGILTNIPLSVVIPLFYAVFVTSSLAYSLITYANSILPASITTAFWPLQVLVATSLASYFFGETINATDAVGGVSIVLGMLTIAWSNYQAVRTNARTVDHAYAAVLSEKEGGRGEGPRGAARAARRQDANPAAAADRPTAV